LNADVTAITITPSTIFTSSDTNIYYFFFKEGGVGPMNGAQALCSILHQLFISTSKLNDYALERHKEHDESLTTKFPTLWQILQNASSSIDGETVCILDALDECEENGRQEIIDSLKQLYSPGRRLSSPTSKLKFLVTSRPYRDLEISFEKFPATTYLRLDGAEKSEQISREINLVIDDKVPKITHNFTDGDRLKISEHLKSKKNRTYLWLHLTLDIIEKSPSEYGKRSDVERLLSDIPSEIADAYEKILSLSKNPARTKILLQIVLAAERPLTLDEANIVLTLQEGQVASHADLDSGLWPRGNFEGVVKDACNHLISIHDSTLTFIHQTAREFLMHKNKGAWQGRFTMPESHSTMSRSCLGYLLLQEFTVPIQPSSIDSQKYPFLPYASANWPLHYVSQQTAVANVDRRVARILCDLRGPQARLWASDYLTQRYKRVEGWTDLALASYIGLALVVDDISNQGNVNINAQGGEYGTALQAASERGHKEVVQVLVDKNADVNAQGGEYGTALYVASVGGHKEVVQILLENGANGTIK
jgi:hypothetical protein